MLAITEPDFVRVADISEIPPGEMKAVKIGAYREILLVNVGGTIHACDNWCSHQSYRLSAGDVDGNEVRCDLHGAKFDVTSGEPTAAPAIKPIKVFEVRVDGSDVLVNRS